MQSVGSAEALGHQPESVVPTNCKVPSIHTGTLSSNSTHPVLIVSQNLKLLIYVFLPPLEIN